MLRPCYYGEQPDRDRDVGDRDPYYLLAHEARLKGHEARIGIKAERRKIGKRPGPEYLSAVEVSIEVGASVRAINAWSKTRGLPVLREGRGRKMNWYRLCDVLRWMSENGK